MAFDVSSDDTDTDTVNLGTPFFPLRIDCSEISIKNRGSTAASVAQTKLRIHALHDVSSIGTNLLDNYIDFILHQSIPLVTGGDLSISANAGNDLIRFFYVGIPAAVKKTDFMGGHLTGVSQIGNGATKLKLGSGSSDVTIHGINESVAGSTTTYIGNKLHLRDDDTYPDCWIRWGGYSNTGGALNVVSNGLQLHGFDSHEFHIGAAGSASGVTPGIPIRMRLNTTGLYVAGSFFQPHNFSDDRLKTGETPLAKATEALLKLKPQTYLKSAPESNKDPMSHVA